MTWGKPQSLWARLWSPGSCCFAGGMAGRHDKQWDRDGTVGLGWGGKPRCVQSSSWTPAWSILHELGISEHQASRGSTRVPSRAAAPIAGAWGAPFCCCSRDGCLSAASEDAPISCGFAQGRFGSKEMPLRAQGFSVAPPAHVLGLDPPPGVLSWLVSWNFPSFGLYLG